MADEATAAPGEDTQPTDSAPQGEDTRTDAAPGTPDTAGTEPDEQVDYEKRYNDLLPDYTRKSQALKEAEQAAQVVAALQSDDPQERAWAADILGIDLMDEDGDSDGDGDDEFRDPRVDHLLAEREQEQRERQLEQLEKHIDTTIETLDKKHQTGLSDEEKDWIFTRTLSLPPGEDGQPPVSRAFEEFTGIMDNRIKRYRESKKAPSAPVPGGESASSQTRPGDRKARQARALEVVDRAFRSHQT